MDLIWLPLDCVILPAPVPKLALAATLPVPSHSLWPSPTHSLCLYGLAWSKILNNQSVKILFLVLSKRINKPISITGSLSEYICIHFLPAH